MAGIRASDADREHTAELLRAAAGEGRLTVEELDQRLAAAYGAVSRGELAPLTADLPLPPPVVPPPPVRPSRFWIWAFLPWLGAVAFVHAGLVSRANRYYALAVPYAVPILLGILFDDGPSGDAEFPDWVMAIVIAFWIVGAVHAFRERPQVDRRRAELMSRRGTTTP